MRCLATKLKITMYMKNNIIYQLNSFLLKKAFYNAVLLTVFCFSTNAQPGANDPTFNPGTGANSWVWTTALQSDGKIIIGGDFTSYNGITRNYIARLNTDGTLDDTYNTSMGANNHVFTTALQNDGRIIIGGDFTSYNGTSRNYIARLNVDGTLDATFNPGTGANNTVGTTTMQSDGKIIICGSFTSYNGTIIHRIARLNVDGTLDANFNPGTGANNAGLNCGVYTTSIQSDGKIIIGGDYTSYNETPINGIARLNTDGTLDATFNLGMGAGGYVYSTSIQSDGKIIIGGAFNSYNGTTRNSIARLNADGMLDANFNPGSGLGGVYPYVSTTAVQSDGKIIIGGTFTSYNGTIRKFILCLKADGTLDTTFNPSIGANDCVNTTAIQSDGKIIIGGNFTSYNGTGRNRIARILGGNAGISSMQSKTIYIYPNPVSEELNIEAKGNNEQLYYEIMNLYGKVLFTGNFYEKTIVQLADLVPGVYLVKLVTNKGFEIKKIIKE